MTAERLLEGVRVVEFATEIAGPYCSKMLVDAGAEVVKVEPAQGDSLRGWSASGSDPGGRAGALFRFLNASKRSIVGSVASPEVDALIDDADLVIESGELSVADIARLRRRHGRPSVVSVTPFGKTGPWADKPWTEFTLQAMSGSTGGRGVPEEEPLYAGGRIGEYLGGTYAAIAAVSLVLCQRAGGPPDHVDASMLESMNITMAAYKSLQVSLLGPESIGASRSVEVPSIVPTADGDIGFCTVTRQQFLDFLLLIERQDLVDDAEILLALGRQRRREEFLAIVEEWTTARSTAEIIEVATALRIPVTPVGRPDTVAEIDQFIERGVFVPHGDGDFVQPRRPYLVDGLRAPMPGKSPELGEATGSFVWAEPTSAGAGFYPKRATSASDGAHQVGKLLQGLRVLDLTAFWAGPSATQVFAALGAEVIKIESIQRPDGMRFSTGKPATEPSWWEWSSFYQAVNANKLDVTLDLNSARGRELVVELAAECDVFIENFSPRVLDGFGITREVLHAANPDLVIARMPAFGLDGPWRDRTGFAQTMEQASGMAWLTGFGDGPPIIPRGPCDPIAGIHAAFAVLAALVERGRSGDGHFLECTMVEGALNIAAEMVVEYSANGSVLRRDGNRGPVAAPQGLYLCDGGDEDWIAIAVATDEQWARLVRLIDDPDWSEAATYESVDDRRAHADEIDEHLRRWVSQRSNAEVVEALWAADIPASAVVLAPDVVDLPQIRARGYVEVFDHQILGRHEVPTLPFTLASRTAPWITTPSPMLGQHNSDVLGRILGIGPAELAQLEADGVIGSRPVGA